MDEYFCPLCNADLRGQPIPQESIDKGYYGSPETAPRWYSRMIGHEIPGIYDGVLYWTCPDCNKAWHRWSKNSPDMRSKAQPYIDKHNKGMA